MSDTRPAFETDGEASDSAIDAVLAERTWKSLRPTGFSLAILYVVFAISHPFVQSAEIAPTLAAVAVTTALAFLGLAVGLERIPIPERYAYPLAFGVVVLALVNSGLHLHLTGDPRNATNLIFILFAASVFITSTPWFAASGLLIVGWWMAFAVTMDDADDRLHFTVAMLAALSISWLLQYIRVRALREVERLRVLSEHRRKQVELLASQDFLTGVANRRRFFERLEWALADSQRADRRVGLLYLDLDGFKQVNDTYGHAFGDEVLETVANRLRAAIRKTDLPARVGGDEFAVLLTFLEGRDDLATAVERISESLAEIQFPGKGISVSASIGTALFPDDGRTVEEFIEAADTAMYRAKRTGSSE
ncbi:MAG: GGDEF domain-containing protein [Acidimicrobiia bacterium]|nr:GGDEF domain-containing protein [Acidimicrobiia bacterium]